MNQAERFTLALQTFAYSGVRVDTSKRRDTHSDDWCLQIIDAAESEDSDRIESGDL
jgi:hypothetical protein